MKNKSVFQYIAGGCFLGCAVTIVIPLVRYGFTWMRLFLLTGGILTAVGLALMIPVLSAVGCGLCAIASALEVFDVLETCFYHSFFIAWAIVDILVLVVWVLLAVAFVNRKNAKVLSVAAAAGELISVLIFVVVYRTVPVAQSLIADLLLIIGAVFAGLALSSMPVKIPQNTSSTSTSSSSQSSASPALRIEKLKGLLDQGVISQEEFDAKKKEILDL
jgi:hypothetical protein